MSATAEPRKVRKQREDGLRSRRTILDAAAKLATVEGLEGLSIGRLAEHIGMSKSGLYAHFGSKEELQLATIETASEIFDEHVVRPSEDFESPLARLETLCEAFLRHLELRVFPGGCFFASAAAEFDTHPGAVKEQITSYSLGWLTALEDLVTLAQEAGELDPRDDPAQVAFEIDAHLLMANTAFLLYNEPKTLDRARAAIRARLRGPAGR
ncbi:MAG TPA: helix-turn-helix domain-containing protein [Gaiellaceae bacterium]|nr:helix-turn-helix domain-containing protein [Gaiellaceae bacterium]